MNTYTLASGEIVEYPEQAPIVNEFIRRAGAALADPSVSPGEMVALVYGSENPILDTTSVPGRAIVNRAIFENPVYRILSDMVGRKQLLVAGQTREQVIEPFTLTVRDAAEQLGLTEAGVRAAINGRKLSAVKKNAEWYIHPNSVASYKVSHRGRKKAALGAPSVVEIETEGGAPVSARLGSVEGAGLFVRVAGVSSDLVRDKKEGNITEAHFPSQWRRAAVKTTTKAPGGSVRVFEIEPAPGANEAIRHGDLSVTGAFRIVKKHSATKAATEVWSKYANEGEPATT